MAQITSRIRRKYSNLKSSLNDSLTEVTAEMLDGITNIRSYAFAFNRSLKRITIPPGITSIGDRAFMNSGLQSITILPGVAPINFTSSSYHFQNCTNLTSVRTASSIGDYAFRGKLYSTQLTPNIETLELLDGVESIGSNAFEGTKIASLTFPSSLTEIKNYAFQDTKITSLTVPSTLTQIKDYAFYNCTLLQNVEFSEGYQSFNIYNIFGNCTALEEVIFPSSLNFVYGFAFGGCNALTRIIIKATTPPRTRGDTLQFLYGADNAIIYVPSGAVDAYKTNSLWSTYADRIQAIPSK